jgi:hypothetical protein
MTGFNSKRDAAADKAQDGKCKLCIDGCAACDARAQPPQAPVAWPCLIAEADFSQDTVTLTMQCDDYKVSAHKHWLSTTPPKREWVRLTNDEVNNFAAGCHLGKSVQGAIYEAEAKLKEKNT